MAKTKLPFVAKKILGIILPKEDADFLLEDYRYLYEKKIESTGAFKAFFWLIIIILKSIPDFLVLNFVVGSSMIKNYIKIAFRNLSKYKLISFINILGLSTAIGISIVSFLFLDFTYNRDQFHTKADQTFLIHRTIETYNGEELWGTTPLPLGKAIKEKYSSVENFVRIRSYDVKVKKDDVVFEERIFFTERSYLDVFDFNVVRGDKDALNIKNSVILTEDLAKKYFGSNDPIGQQIELIYFGNEKKIHTVRAVLENYPKNSSFALNIILPFNDRPDFNDKSINEWTVLCDATFIQLKKDCDIKQLENNIQEFIAAQNAANINNKMKRFILEPLNKMAEDSYKVKADLVYVNLHPGQILSMLFLGITILLMACFNYMNISLGSGSNRTKEIAIRKVIGGRQKNIISQHLTENLVIAFIVLVLGILSAKFIFIPLFSSFFTIFDFEINLLQNWRLLLYFVFLIGFVGIVSGIYPAFYISSFNPVNIFRKKGKFKQNGYLTKTLIVIQFVFAFISLVSGINFYLNNAYQYNRDWGYNQFNKIGIQVNNTEQYNILKNTLISNSNIISQSASYYNIGRSYGQSDIHLDGKNYMSSYFPVGFNICKTLELNLIEGRDFEENHRGTIANQVIVNEAFLSLTRLVSPIGKTFSRNDINYQIVGVVKDFHFQDFMKEIVPVVFYHTAAENYRYLYLSCVPGSINKLKGEIKSIWKEKFPDYPFNIIYQDQAFSQYMDAMEGLAKFSSFNGLVSLIITCMGIFGIVSLSINKQLKEINIRKVLGATKLDLINLVNKGFLGVLLTSLVIGLPTSYFITQIFLDSLWKYYRPLDFVPFTIALTIVIISTIITVSSQYFKTINSNPCDALKEN